MLFLHKLYYKQSKSLIMFSHKQTKTIQELEDKIEEITSEDAKNVIGGCGIIVMIDP